MSSQDGPESLECITAAEVYPPKDLVVEDKSLRLPFPCLPGEFATFLGRTAEGVIALSNFRIVICYKDAFVNVPLGLIEMLECRDIFFLHLYLKDARIIRCTFPNNDSCMEWYRRLSNALEPPQKLDQTFAFVFCAYAKENSMQEAVDCCSGLSGCGPAYSFGKEVDRMGFDLKGAWRISYWNDNHAACPTYPDLHIVPTVIDEKTIEAAAAFRSIKRLPSVVWRDRRSGAIIARSSQPEVGWLGWRNNADEALLQAIAMACALNPGTDATDTTTSVSNGVSNGHVSKIEKSVEAKKLLIVDARSYAAAVANRAKGGGCECPEYYPNCEIQFMSLANIHSIRKSFQALRTLCSSQDPINWMTSLENSKWLQHICSLMKAALMITNVISHEGRPVLIHCSDGWDRTPQLVALAELMLDPYYRTFEGFQILVEREWLDFGHKFGDRCGHGVDADDVNERCPVFLQFLDCVRQLLKQFPCAFEFNETFLVKLVQHVYSCLFGTFLCNTTKQRKDEKLKDRTLSVWALLRNKPWSMKNYLYSPRDQVLRPNCHIRVIDLWSAVYLAPEMSLSEEGPELCRPLANGDIPEDQKQEQTLLPKTRSCDDIVAALEHTSSLTRRSSDPSLGVDVHSDPQFLIQPKKGGKEESTQNNLGEQLTANSNSEKGSTTSVVTLMCNGDLINNDSDVISESDTLASKSNSERSIDNLISQDEDSKTSETDQDSSENTDHTLSFESSTDTLTEELNSAKPLKTIRIKEHKLNCATNISTSTTDISDSHVNINLNEKFHFNGQSLIVNDLTLHLKAMENGRVSQGTQAEYREGSSKGSSQTGSETSTPHTPHTPSSSCPPTPGIEGKSLEPQFPVRGQVMISHHLDSDGLTSVDDPCQERLHQMELEYKQRLCAMERELRAAKVALYQYASGCNGRYNSDNKDEISSLADSTGSGEMQSLGTNSNANSDMSWEQIDERDASMTLWVPDHAVTHCAGCDNEFWVVRRRHHCRNCGKIYCSQCTDFFIPIPAQQLTAPVRVCRICYKHLLPTANHYLNGNHCEPLAAPCS